MNDYQFDLFEGQALARGSDPDTSHDAAQDVQGGKASRMEQQVLDMLKQYPDGLTGHELVHLTGIPYQSCTPRIRPLVRKGLVIDSGNRREGPCRKQNIIWKANTGQ